MPNFVSLDDLLSEVPDLLVAPAPPSRSTVPDFVGLPIREARLIALRVGFHLDSRADSDHPPTVEGVVMEQRPSPGTKRRRGSHISVTLHFEADGPAVPDYYVILGVPPGADMQQIEFAWRRAASEAHPDHGGDVRTFIRIAEAYRVLADPERRVAYDNYRRTEQ